MPTERELIEIIERFVRLEEPAPPKGIRPESARPARSRQSADETRNEFEAYMNAHGFQKSLGRTETGTYEHVQDMWAGWFAHAEHQKAVTDDD